MLEVANLTDFAHLTFSAIDGAGELTHVLVAKATYGLTPLEDPTSETSFALRLAEAGTELFVKDDYFGEINKSSVRTESDLAPFKPKCDLTVIGSAHSPTGRPVDRVEVGIDIDRDQARLHSHRLRVLGERDILRRDLIDRGAAAVVWVASAGQVEAPKWYLTEPQPFMDCPLRYELAFGGALRVEADDPCADRIAEQDRLSEAARAKHPDGDKAPVAHKACRMNPVGRGFIEAWHLKATRLSQHPAPRIEAVAAPFTGDLVDALVKGQSTPGSCAGLSPQGFGVVTKAWQPRLRLAGTYDDEWRQSRWPNPPHDYDMAYWNGAHPSMQCEHLQGGEIVTLTNLLPAAHPGTKAAGKDATIATFRVPDEGLALRLEMDGKRVFFAVLPIDTLTIDLESMEVHVAWRLRGPADLPVRAASLLCLTPLTTAAAAKAASASMMEGR